MNGRGADFSEHAAVVHLQEAQEKEEEEESCGGYGRRAQRPVLAGGACLRFLATTPCFALKIFSGVALGLGYLLLRRLHFQASDTDEEGEIKSSSAEDGEVDPNDKKTRKRKKLRTQTSKDQSDSDDDGPEKKSKKHKKKKKHKDAAKKRRKVGSRQTAQG